MKIFFSLGFLWLLLCCSSTKPKPIPKNSAPETKIIPTEAVTSAVPFPETTDTTNLEKLQKDTAEIASTSKTPNAMSTELKTTSSYDTSLIPSHPRPKNLAKKIHVLLSKGSKSLPFYSLGEVQILAEDSPDTPTSSEKKPHVTKILSLRGAFTVRRSRSTFEICQGKNVLQATPAKRLRVVAGNPHNLLNLGGTVYRGGMHILSEPNGGISAVNVLDLEDYLRGVLPYELGTVNREALEALKALAVVARTYAVKRMLRTGNPDFHVYDDVQDQVYKGVKDEYLLSDRAVQETRGMVVMHQDTLAQCYYFSTCGGRTANKNEVWGGDSAVYLSSQSDSDEAGEPFCKASKYSNWTETWTLPQLTSILNKNLKSAGISEFTPFNSLKNIEVTSLASCGRVRILRITTNNGVINLKGDKVRWALRPNTNQEKILPSAWFDISINEGTVTAMGHGFGHGIGLCQVGAIGRAREHQGFKEIISAYYPGVLVVALK